MNIGLRMNLPMKKAIGLLRQSFELAEKQWFHERKYHEGGAHKTHLVEFMQDRQVQVSEGESLLEASLAAGYHACGGNARCSTCRVLVTEGADRLTPPNEREKALNRIFRSMSFT